MSGVEWSGVESTGLDSPYGVYMDFLTLRFSNWSGLESSGVQWSPLDSVGYT